MTTDPQWDAALDEDVPRLARLLRETGAEEIEIGDAARTIRVRRASTLGVLAIEAAVGEDGASSGRGSRGCDVRASWRVRGADRTRRAAAGAGG